MVIRFHRKNNLKIHFQCSELYAQGGPISMHIEDIK